MLVPTDNYISFKEFNNIDVDPKSVTEGKHGTQFRGKKDILTKVTKDIGSRISSILVLQSTS